jgi:hypothetical protein
MARLFGITLAPGIDIYYNQAIKMYDIAMACNVGRNPKYLTRSRKYNLKEATKLFQTAFAWNTLSQVQKDAWYTAANITGINGYALFTQDRVYRFMNSLVGNATPSIYHQYKVGHIKINSPANKAIIEYRNIVPYVLPAVLRISYNSALSVSGGSVNCKCILETLLFRDGKNIIETESIDIGILDSWNTKILNLASKAGHIISWKIRLILENVIGDFYFDNIEFEYLATIQNDDSECDEFPKYWNVVNGGDNVIFESIYPSD